MGHRDVASYAASAARLASEARELRDPREIIISTVYFIFIMILVCSPFLIPRVTAALRTRFPSTRLVPRAAKPRAPVTPARNAPTRSHPQLRRYRHRRHRRTLTGESPKKRLGTTTRR